MSLSALGELSNVPLRQRVADSLQRAILDGDLKPGQPLVESEIAAQLGISRAPVREAMQILVNHRLVDVVPYKGAVVRSLDGKDIEEVYGLRSVLEGFAAERAISHGAAQGTRVLRKICDAMQSAASQGDYRALLEADETFHRTLVKLAQHDLLYSAWNDLSMRVRQIMALSNLQFLDIMEIFYNHLPMVEALEAKDAPRAAALVRKHILSSAALVIRSSVEGEPVEVAPEGL